MSKIDEALEILSALGLPRAQLNERSGYTLLALAHVGPRIRGKLANSRSFAFGT